MITLMTFMAFQYLGTPYKWGGNNYDGFDCSGLALKVLHDVGVTLPDMTSQDLYNFCKKNNYSEVIKQCNSLLFFGKSESEITHVAISIGQVENVWLMIEAGGAGSNSLNMTKEELAEKDARVRIKPVSNRKDFIAGFIIPYDRKRT